jgi:O-antigen ligase
MRLQKINVSQTVLVLLGIGLTIFSSFGISNFPLGLSNPAILLFGGILLTVILLQPSFGIMLLLATTWLSTLFPFESGLTLNRAIGLLTLGGWFSGRLFPEKRRHIVFDHLDILFVLYFLVALISIQFNNWYPASLPRLYEILIGYIIFFLMRNTLDSQKKLRWALWTILLASLPVAVSVITGLSDPVVSTSRRLEGIQGVTLTGIFTSIAVLTSLYIAQSSKSRYRNILFLLIPVYGIAVLLSGSRTGLLILIWSFAYILFLSQSRAQKAKVILIILPLLIGSIVLVYAMAPNTIERMLDIPIADLFINEAEIVNVYDVSRRYYLIRAAWDMFTDYPIIGIGLGGYSEHFSLYSPFADIRSVSHNIFLTSLAEMGFIGILVLLCILGVFIIQMWRLRASATSSSDKQLLDFTLALLIGYNIIQAALHGNILNRQLFIVFGFAAVAMDLVQRNETPDEEKKIYA